MDLTRRRIIGTVGASIALAGCTGDDTGATDSPTAEPTGTDTEASPPTVQVRSHPDHGDVLVGPDGLTLYMFDQDEQGSGSSACSGDCLDNWPPLTVEGTPEAGDGVDAELSTFEREDGSTQVAANGWPLYYFAPDEEPGDASGQGAGDVWWVLGPGGVPVKPESTGTETATSTPTDDGGSEDDGGGMYGY